MTFFFQQPYPPDIRQVAGGQLNREAGNPRVTTENGIQAGGTTLPLARPIRAVFNVVETALANNAVALPVGSPGAFYFVWNASANTIRVFVQLGELIDGGLTEVTLTSGSSAMYACVAPRLWRSFAGTTV